MTPIQVVIDTNVMVAALRSRRGASFAMLKRFPEGLFRVNISNTLVLEYEAKLKAEVLRQGHTDMTTIDRFLDYLIAHSNRWSVVMGFPDKGIHQDDQYIFDLAIASDASIIVTFNMRHFQGAEAAGVRVMRPSTLLRLLEDRQ